jgi:hypothetical protein
MNKQRYPAVAGLFYPDDADDLVATIDHCLHDAEKTALHCSTPIRAMIAPHAGYPYSAPIAAMAYRYLALAAKTIRRVILLGPAHRWPVVGVACDDATTWQSPLGTLPIDQDLTAVVQKNPCIQPLPQAFDHEHSLEVHLPFLQRVIPHCTLLPLLVGQIEPMTLAQIVAPMMMDRSNVLIVSSDLSHFLDYLTAKRVDKQTSQAILDGRCVLQADHACGYIAIMTLLKLAQQYQWSSYLLDLRNSGDTAGSRDRVVGYGAYVFS